MGYRSSTCSSRSTGKPLMAYSSETEALNQAQHARAVYKNDMAPYRCSRCSLWHLALQVSRRPLLKCDYCQGRDGNYKNAYPTEERASRHAALIEERAGISLRAYECRHGDGWHLTSK